MQSVKYHDMRAAPPPTMFLAHKQSFRGEGRVFAVKTASDPATMTGAIRAAIHAVDPAIPIVEMTTQANEIEGRLEQERLFAFACSLFGGGSMLLAAIGLFGLVSYSVAQRTREFGIRMALGARRSRVQRMVLGESLLLVGIGVAVGLGAVVASARVLASLLFELSPTDPATLLTVVAVTLAVALVGRDSCRRAGPPEWIPSWRFAATDRALGQPCASRQASRRSRQPWKERMPGTGGPPRARGHRPAPPESTSAPRSRP